MFNISYEENGGGEWGLWN